MTTDSPAGAPQFCVGPKAEPDRYSLGAAVSSGAEGILYRGSITTTAGVTLDVAIKMLQPRFLTNVNEWHVRWSEQVELLRSLQVPGVVPVRDGFLGPLPHAPGQAGEDETLYLVMNWVEGETLDDWVRHRPDRNPIDDLKVLVPVAAALDLMHSGRATGGVPVVHRDIKPANILVTEHGSVLVDFGLTRGLPDGQRLTGVAGTPGYLAPESIDAGSYSAATDRYAFGGVAYFVLTGTEPPRSHQPEAMGRTLTEVPELAGHPEVSDQVMAMLATDPDDRPPSLANWVGQLRRSSIEAGPDILNPAASRRHPSSPRNRTKRRRGRRAIRRSIALLFGFAVIAVAAAFGLAVALRHRPPAPQATLAPASYNFTTISTPHNLTLYQPLSMNNRNTVVGCYGDGSSNYPSKCYTIGKPNELSTLSPCSSSSAQLTGINDSGYCAGFGPYPGGHTKGFVFWQGSSTSYNAPSGSTNKLLGINDAGYAVGYYVDASGISQADIVNSQLNGTPEPHRVGHGVNIPSASSEATGINNENQIVGFQTSFSKPVSFLLSPGRLPNSFSSYRNWTNIQARGINDKMQIVGSWQDSLGRISGFVMSFPEGPRTAWHSVNDPMGIETVVTGINDKEELVGYYINRSGKIHGFLATPKQTH
jgi:serine/threonine protein kinase